MMRTLNNLFCVIRFLPLLFFLCNKKYIIEELGNACNVHCHKKEFGRIARLLNYYPEYRNLVYYRLKCGDYCFWDLLYPRSKSLLLWNDHIGKNVVFWHPLSTLLSGTIGDNCVFRQNITVGNKGTIKSGTPILGNNVDVGCGAMVLGKVKIGNNVTIGAGAVVTRDVPDNAIVVGNPARILRFKDVRK